MNLTVLPGIAALVTSILALLVSSAIAMRQSRLLKQANQVPVIVELFKEGRMHDFCKQEESIWHSLKDCDPSLGVSGLPVEVKECVVNVTGYYQTISYLVAFGVVDQELAALPFHYRIMRTWNALKLFIDQERVIRGGPLTYLNFFEAFASKVEKMDIASGVRGVGFVSRRARDTRRRPRI